MKIDFDKMNSTRYNSSARKRGANVRQVLDLQARIDKIEEILSNMFDDNERRIVELEKKVAKLTKSASAKKKD